MFTARHRDLDAGNESLPGFYIWKCLEAIGFSQAAIHRRLNPVGQFRESRDLETAVGRLSPHWASFVAKYENTGAIGFCLQCNSSHCPINRAHIARILAIYNLCIRLHMSFGDIYVNDMGIPKSDLEIFLTYHVRTRPGTGRFVNVENTTIPSFRDKSSAVYQGGLIDLEKMTRPE